MAGTRFPTTRWSRVLAAAGSSPSGRSAMSELCNRYWYPLYAAVRRKTRDPERASDLTQAFFTRFLEKNDVAAADKARGRFRSWMLACLENFLKNAHDHETTWKAGGRVRTVSIDEEEAEGRFASLPAEAPPDDALFDGLWAVTAVERAMETMRARCRDGDARAFHASVEPLLTLPDTDPGDTAAIASKLSLEPGTFKTRLSRERARLWGYVRAELAETLDDPNDVDEELKYLISVLGALWRM